MDLVVIPNRNDYGLVWCLEYAFERIQDGHQVEFLDLSREQYRYRKFSRYLMDRLIVKKSLLELFQGEVKAGRLSSVQLPKLPTIFKMESSWVCSFADRAILSSYAWEFGSSQFSLSQLPIETVNGERLQFQKIYSLVNRIIQDRQPNRVVTVNGRFLVDCAAVLAAKSQAVEYLVLESDSENRMYYAEFKTNSQSPIESQANILKVWDHGSHGIERDKAERIGLGYIQDKSKFKSIPGRQDLDFSIKHNLENSIVLFPTSDYEFSVFESENSESPNFTDQSSAFSAAVSIAKSLGLTAIVRVHPHARGSQVSIAEDSIWNKFAQEHEITFVSSTSSISSYFLAERAKVSVVHASSIGAEIAFNGLPVAITGDAGYSNLIQEVHAPNCERLRALLSSPKTITDNKVLAPWGFYMTTGLKPLKFFEMKQHTHILYQGTLWAIPRTRLIALINMVAILKRKILRKTSQ